MKRNIVKTICLTFLFQAYSVVGEELISVAGWNIAANAHGTVTPEIEKNIAKGIMKLDADIVGLTEVEHEESLKDIIEELKNSHNLEYQYGICKEEENLSLAVIYKPFIKASKTYKILGTDLDRKRLRKACAISLKAKQFDFALINVHLKSGSGSESVREQQAQSIATFIRGVTFFNEKDVILIGDYNMYPERDKFAFDALSPTGFLRFLSTEALCDENQRNCKGTHIGRNGKMGNLLDGFGITMPTVNEYVEGSFQRVNLHDAMGLTMKKFKGTVADHLPLKASFKTDTDDD